MTDSDPEPPSRTIEIDGSLIGGSLAGRSLDLDWLQRHLERVAARLPRAVSRVTILLLGDAQMRELHRGHMGIDSTTDVLTFAATDPADVAGAIDADIAIGVDEATRQASDRGHDIERELLLYALHGLLHCCGYDDQEPGEYDRMHAMEDQILAEIGIGATFSTSADRAEAPEGARVQR